MEGTTVFTPKLLEKLFYYKPGKPLNRSVLVDGVKTMDALYRAKGYIYAFMNPENTDLTLPTAASLTAKLDAPDTSLANPRRTRL